MVQIYLTLVVNNDQTILQSSQALNIYRVPNPVHITNPLPDLQVTNVDQPAQLEPGQVFAPTIQITNFGTSDPATQGPVTVYLVASLNKTFGPGDSVLATYQIASLPGISGVPTELTSLPSQTNLTTLPNVNVTTLSPIKLPTTPGKYYIGIVIDPTNAIKMRHPMTPALADLTLVTANNSGLPPGELLVNTNGTVPVFPALPSTVIGPTTTTTVATPLFPTNTSTVSALSVTAASLKTVKKHKSR